MYTPISVQYIKGKGVGPVIITMASAASDIVNGVFLLQKGQSFSTEVNAMFARAINKQTMDGVKFLMFETGRI